MVTKCTRKDEILDIFVTNLSHCYNVPEIIPPVPPDDPCNGVPSDHHVPLCIPHTDPLCPPKRDYKVITSRPLPESKLELFGKWLTTAEWDNLDLHLTPQGMLDEYNKVIFEKLDQYCPIKRVKLGFLDKPWTTPELKTLKRRRQREYCKKGKSLKYKKLQAEFEVKTRKAAQNYMMKNIEALKITNPGQTFNILKRMGAPPGQIDESATFTLDNHEHLSSLESAEQIAHHFSKISQEFPPLSCDLLPDRVNMKLKSPESESPVPKLEPFDVYRNILAANKPKSGVPWDLPKKIVTEFAPELSTPVCKIYNSIVQSAKHSIAAWPPEWKVEWGTPLQKKSSPKTEDDLRIISLTAFLSKVMEKFVMTWLLFYVGDQLDPRQYGGLKNNSVAHYLIEMINFILYNQDFSESVAVLVCTIDFSKAFNRVNHNILITKLSDMGVPGWLLNLVMGFLSDRKMKVRYKGNITGERRIPGGGPQGSLLGGFLFLILINLCGFREEYPNVGEQICVPRNKFEAATLHVKFVDDMTLLESIDLKKNLAPNPDRALPDPYRCRLGQTLPPQCSKLYDQAKAVQCYADQNEMKLNCDKSQFMLFNPCINYDFLPELSLDNQTIECTEKMKLLGVQLQSDLKWRDNTDMITKKAYSRLWTIRRLMKFGTSLEDLKDVYYKQVRSILEFSVPVWNSNITKQEICDIERVQKCFLHIILGDEYDNYQAALQKMNMETLEKRRRELCETFARKTAENPKFKHWFKIGGPKTRSDKIRYCVPEARTSRFMNSPIPYLIDLLNSQ